MAHWVEAKQAEERRRPGLPSHDEEDSRVELRGVDLGSIPPDEDPNFQALLEANVEREEQKKRHSGGGGFAFSLGIFASVIGNMLEFYDFSVYAFFAPEIGNNFFPKGDPVLQSVKTFAVFGSGFMMRPLGSMLLGAIGDHFGTVVALRWSIALMSIPTVLTGCLPTIHQIGPVAAVLLTLLRLLQGLSVGGEYVGAILHTADSDEGARRRGLYGGLIASMCVAGNLLGSATATAVHTALPEAEVLRWGWRVPFLCGSVLGVVGILLRSREKFTEAGSEAGEDASAGTAEEANGATHAQHHRHHHARKSRRQRFMETARSTRRSDIPALVLTAVLSMMLNLAFYTNISWLGTYLARLAPHPLKASDAFAAVCVLQACAVISMPLFGNLGDVTGGRMLWHAAGTIAFAVAQPLAWMLLQSGKVSNAYIYAVIMGPMTGFAYSGNFWGWITEELSGIPSRYFAVGVAYNIGAMMGGLYPTAASGLIKSGYYMAPVLPLCGFAAFTVIAIVALRVVESKQGVSRKTSDVDAYSAAPAVAIKQ